MEFLNSYAPAIQAIGAVASVVVAGILAFITWRYVQLTREQSEASREQVAFLNEQVQASRRELFGLIRMFRIYLELLPREKASAEGMRKIALWNDKDSADLLRLSSIAGLEPGKTAGEICVKLNQVVEKVGDVKGTEPRSGYDWGRFDWDEWKELLEGIEQELKVLWNQFAGTEGPEYDRNKVSG